MGGWSFGVLLGAVAFGVLSDKIGAKNTALYRHHANHQFSIDCPCIQREKRNSRNLGIGIDFF